ncbi:MAG: threonylcarbamoyl-AMP synthase, partial [Chlamydiales bacterium]|nr:threonylcarbamoyl-AMP synthase [Chlamydiales bacterium]
EAFFLLAKAFWPGPLTMVLKRRAEVPSLVSAGHPTIAVRMPAHSLALRLIEAVGEPLVAPSANLSGKPSPTEASHVREDLGDKVSLVLDGGQCAIGIESTVIYLAGTSPVLLRPGSIRKEELEAVLQTRVMLTDHQGPVYSPGMLHRHYSPKARVRLFLDPKDLPSTHPYLLSSEERPSSLVFNRRNFYALLREADRQGVKEIAIYCSPFMQQDAGLMNRVFRCAGFSL